MSQISKKLTAPITKITRQIITIRFNRIINAKQFPRLAIQSHCQLFSFNMPQYIDTIYNYGIRRRLHHIFT